MSDASDMSDDEPPIYFENRMKRKSSQEEETDDNLNTQKPLFLSILQNLKDSSDSDSSIVEMSQPSNAGKKKSPQLDRNKIPVHPNETKNTKSELTTKYQNNGILPLNFSEMFSQSQPFSIPAEPLTFSRNSQPRIFSIPTETESENNNQSTQKDDIPDLRFDHINRNYETDYDNFSNSFQIKHLRVKSLEKNPIDDNNSQNNSDDYLLASPENGDEVKMQKELAEARENYQKMLNEQIKQIYQKYNKPLPKELGNDENDELNSPRFLQRMPDYEFDSFPFENLSNDEINAPPAFENMSDDELTDRLANFGFKFRNRDVAISKLYRCWNAIKESEKDDNDEQHEQPIMGDISPIDFIRLYSKFYEDILVYQPIPLASLFREMRNAGVKISVTKLRTMLDNEGVCFADDINAVYPSK